MDRSKLSEFFEVWNKNRIIGKTENGTTLAFARQSMRDVEEIESMSDDELVDHWKSLVFTNYIYGCVSLNEMERIALIELEFMDRPDISKDELSVWWDKTDAEYQQNSDVEGDE